MKYVETHVLFVITISERLHLLKQKLPKLQGCTTEGIKLIVIIANTAIFLQALDNNHAI